jgi:hypothetical protein
MPLSHFCVEELHQLERLLVGHRPERHHHRLRAGLFKRAAQAEDAFAVLHLALPRVAGREHHQLGAGEVEVAGLERGEHAVVERPLPAVFGPLSAVAWLTAVLFRCGRCLARACADTSTFARAIKRGLRSRPPACGWRRRSRGRSAAWGLQIPKLRSCPMRWACAKARVAACHRACGGLQAGSRNVQAGVLANLLIGNLLVGQKEPMRGEMENARARGLFDNALERHLPGEELGLPSSRLHQFGDGRDLGPGPGQRRQLLPGNHVARAARSKSRRLRPHPRARSTI